MVREASRSHVEAIAVELIDLLGSGRQVAPFSAREAGFDLAEAYAVVEAVRRLRLARGETPAGRKIGFTNRTVWGSHGISAPIWNHMFDSTVRPLPAAGAGAPLDGLPEPRIEPEIVLHLAKAPSAVMSEDALLECIDWISPGFEIVFSPFPGWTFTAADAAAGYGLHGMLLIGERSGIADDRAGWGRALREFTVELRGSSGARATGHAANVLGGPLDALRFLVEELDRFPGSPPLAPGEIVTTGTLTEVMPAVPGDTWTATFTGIAVRDARLTLA